MHRLKDYEKYRLNVPELKLVLTQMGFFSNFKRKKILLNTRLFSKPKNKTEDHVELHLDVSKRIDELIEKNKEDEQINDDKNFEIPRIVEPRFVEIRESATRAPETPTFQTSLGPGNNIGDLNNIQEFIEIAPPSSFSMENQPENKGEFDSWMTNNQPEKDQKTFQALGPIKLNAKGKEPEKTKTNPTKNNDTTIAKIELEEAKKEIERKKKELEEALKKEKQKEIEVKKEEEERRELEKLRKIELKKKQKEDKIRQKLAEKKALIEKELELKRQEELKRLELLKKLKLEEKIAEEEKLLKEERLLKEEKLPPNFTDVLRKKKEISEEHLVLDEDVAKLIPIIDSLFEKLPEEVVDEFTKSEYFQLYEKVLLKYKNK